MKKHETVYQNFTKRNSVNLEVIYFQQSVEFGQSLEEFGKLGSISSTSYVQLLLEEILKSQKRQSSFQSFWDLWVQKLVIECWWNWHLGRFFWKKAKRYDRYEAVDEESSFQTNRVRQGEAWGQFHQHFIGSFWAYPESAKNTVKLLVFLCFWDLSV